MRLGTLIIACFVFAVGSFASRSEVISEEKIAESGLIVRGSKGASLPYGLEGITSEMSPEQVISRLGSIYKLERDTQFEGIEGLVDSFYYYENGEEMYAHIFYENGSVQSIVYGFAEFRE